jgi:hypothetical protein
MTTYMKPILAFPRMDREYILITNPSSPTEDLPVGINATLAQEDKDGQIHVISNTSRQ